MSTQYRWFLEIICCLCLLQGCVVVRVPQVENTAELLKSVFNDAPDSLESVRSSWSARVGDEGRLVNVVEQDGFFVFVSTVGDAIAFDGWDIRSIIGFDSQVTRGIVVNGDQKQYRKGNSVATALCKNWVSGTFTSGKPRVWIQDCDGQIRPNVVLVDAEGAIYEINQVIDMDGTRAILKRL